MDGVSHRFTVASGPFLSTIRQIKVVKCRRQRSSPRINWCGAHGLELKAVRPFHVAAWIEDFPGSKPTIKQKLAAVRMLYDFLVVRQITPSNPAHSVRGPKYVVKKGKTPVWSREDAKTPPGVDSQGFSVRLTRFGTHCGDVLQLRPSERSPELKADDY